MATVLNAPRHGDVAGKIFDDDVVRPILDGKTEQCCAHDHNLHWAQELADKHLPERLFLLGHLVFAVNLREESKDSEEETDMLAGRHVVDENCGQGTGRTKPEKKP